MASEKDPSARGEHPDLDRLADYLAGTLDDAAEQAVRDHLVACPPCARELLDLQAFEEDAASPVEAATQRRTQAAWRAVRETIDHQERAKPFHRPLLRLAAALLLPILGLAIWLVLGSGTGGGQEVLIVELPLVARGSPETLEIEIPRGVKTVVFAVRLSFAQRFSDYRFHLSDPDGHEIQDGDLPLTEAGILEVTVPRKALPDGSFRIRITASSEGGPLELVNREIQVRPP